MKQISVTELQRQMRDITTGLIRGESYTLMRNGKPLATIKPVPEQLQVEQSPRPAPKPFRPLPKTPAQKLQEDITGKKDDDYHI